MIKIRDMLCVGAMLAAAGAHAAEVGSGTLSLGQLTLEFDGGPIVGTNATNAGGDALQCQDPVLPCDTFALSVDLPDNLTEFFPTAIVRVGIGPTQNLSGADDYDLNLYDGSGRLLGSSTSPGATESVSVIAFGGVRDYTVEVVHWLVAGGSYAAKMELSLGAPSEDKTDAEVAQWLSDNGGDPEASSRVAESCTMPGKTILTDPSGDVRLLIAGPVGLPVDALDLTEFSLFQTGSVNDPEDPALLNFRLKAVSLAETGPIPSSSYFVSFSPRGGSPIFGVRMQVDDQGGVSFFSYTASPNNDGGIDGRFVGDGTQRPAHPSSFFDDSGEIVIAVEPRAVGVLEPGDLLVGFNASTTFGVSIPGVGGVADTPDPMPNDLSRSGSFTFLSDEDCAADADGRSTPVARERGTSAAVQGGALGGSALLFLGTLLLAGRRRGR